MLNNIRIPLRIILYALVFLYIIVPIPFVTGIRDLIGFTPVRPSDQIQIAFFAFCTFSIFLATPKNIFLDFSKFKQDFPNVAVGLFVITILQIILYLYLFGLQTEYFYDDKVISHKIYEEISQRFNLRTIYNIGLLLLVCDFSQNGFKFRHLLFFIPPAAFEVIYSRHNYLTHLLLYGYFLLYSSRVSSYIKYLVPFLLVIVILLLRFLLYSGSGSDAYSFLSALLGEFNISYQASFFLIDMPAINDSHLYAWYSDIVTSYYNLEFGLSGNPIAEAIYYAGDFYPIYLISAACIIVVILKYSLKNTVLTLSAVVITFYFRDIMRTGFLMFFSIYFKSVLFFGSLKLFSVMKKSISRSEVSGAVTSE